MDIVHRLGLLVGLVGVCLLLGAPIALACDHVQPQTREIGSGPGPSGARWTATASIGSDGVCFGRLVSVDIRPFGTVRGSHSWGWRISLHGHLPRTFTLAAQDEGAAMRRVFYGVAGTEVQTIELTTSRGEHLKFRPKRPSATLRQRYIWLHAMRYFVYYYPSDQHVRLVKLFNAQGKLILTRRGEEGEFNGLFGL